MSVGIDGTECQLNNKQAGDKAPFLTIRLHINGLLLPFLISAIESSSFNCVACSLIQSRAAVDLVGADSVTGTGGGVREH